MDKKLTEICKIQYGYAFDSAKFSDSVGVPLIRIRDVVRGYSETYTSEECSTEYVVRDGDMLIGMDGEFNISRWKGGKAYLNQRVCRLIPTDEVDALYLFYFMPKALKEIEDKTPFVTVKHLSAKELNKVIVPIPAMEEQKKIANSLQKVDKLISLRKEQLAKLDQLVKSRFIELFGDPMANPIGWDRVNISAVIAGKVSNGFFAKRDDYCDGGNVKVLGVAHVVNRMYSNSEDLPTTNGTEADIVKYGVKYGDMLFCRSSLVAAGIGKASIVPKGVPSNVLFECHVIRLPLDLNKCVPEFMQVLSTTDYFRNQVISQSKTATMTTIGQDGILKTEIILPPLELQKQFLSFVEQTDKSKLAIQRSLDKLETLKKALMQKCFG